MKEYQKIQIGVSVLILILQWFLFHWLGNIVFSLSPYSFDVSPSCTDVPQITHDSIPIGAIPILASSPPEYTEAVSRTINLANIAYQGEKTMKYNWIHVMSFAVFM